MKITEKQFQQHIIHLATLHGYLTYHTHNSRRSNPGFPDLTLIRPPASSSRNSKFPPTNPPPPNTNG